jgi:predicted cobalt transporter CbtA
LVRGLLAGLLAGLCALAFAKLVAEPQVARAEQFERAFDARAGKVAAKPLVARDVQDTAGLGVGIAVAGVALGGLFGLGFAAAYGRVGQGRARVTAGALAATAFVGVFVVPFLKYPATPPSVGNPDTIGRRTELYFLMMVVGLSAVGLAVTLYRRLSERLRSWDAALLAGGLLIAIVVAAYEVMPGIDEVPFAFPASVLWKFRLASAGTQLILWSVLGLTFGRLTERAETKALCSTVKAPG